MGAGIIDAEETEIAVRDNTGEEIMPIDTLEGQIISMIPRAGTLDLPAEKLALLHEPLNPEIIEIRPDGLIYLPWMEYARRMNEVFGISWVLVPDGKPKLEGNLVMWGFHLVISGVYMGYAMGEQEYQASNRRMTWGDACEGSQSNALMRLCAKRLGIGLELWQPAFIREWKAKYAESYNDKGRQNWRRKDGGKQTQQVSRVQDPERQGQEPVERQPEDTTVILKYIHAFAGDMAIVHERLHNWCASQKGKDWNNFTSLAKLDVSHLLSVKSALEKMAKDDIKPEHIALIIELADEAGLGSIDDKKFKKYAKEVLTFEIDDIEKLNGFQGIAVVKALRATIKVLREVEAAEADKAQAAPQDDNASTPDKEILMDEPNDFFPKDEGKVSNNPQHKTPEEMGKQG